MAFLDLHEGILSEFASHPQHDLRAFAAEAGLTRKQRTDDKWQAWLANKPREWVLAAKREYARRARASMTDEQRAARNAYQRAMAKRKVKS